MNNREKGYFYEERAMEIFKEKGYEILEKNYYTKVGEIDFISMKDEMLVFVEVKYRKNNNFGSGAEAVTKSKLKKIFLASQKYMLYNKLKFNSYRYDLIVFTGKEVEWMQDILRGDEIGCYMP
ncbi:MAG: YraN family protein [Fusobacteriaceae bacterium]|nr:YraN family protein [Fusobacteriaceae bacterium]